MRRPTCWLAALVVLMGGCSSSTTSRTPRESVVVGLMAQPAPSFSDEVARGVQIAVHDYNESSQSRFEAKIQRGDTNGTAEGAGEAARQIAGAESLIGVVGPFVAVEVAGAGPVFDELGIPFLVPSVGDVSVSQAGFRQFRRTVADNRGEGSALTGAGRPTKLALFHDGTSSGLAYAEGAKQRAESNGGTVTRMQEASGTIDWPALAGEILIEPPTVVMHGGSSDRSGALVSALRAAGFKGNFFASRQALDDPKFSEAAGTAAEGTFTASVCAAIDDPDLRPFASRHRELFRAKVGMCAHEAYEATLMLLEAVQEVEPEPAQVSQFFHTAGSFLGDARRYEYGEDGALLTTTVWLWTFTRGEWRFVRRLG